jgi:hypothetical protein
MSVTAETKYLEFRELQMRKGLKTRGWGVLAKSSGALLGIVRWYGAWRAYCFWPSSETIFNEGCLDDIAAFCKTQTLEQRKPASSDAHGGVS